MIFTTWEKKIRDILDVDVKDIIRRKRDSKTELARCMLWYILHHECGLSITQLTKRYKRKRRNVYYAIANMKFRIEKQKEYKTLYESVVNKKGDV